jgi:hypothetical protein
MELKSVDLAMPFESLLESCQNITFSIWNKNNTRNLIERAVSDGWQFSTYEWLFR